MPETCRYIYDNKSQLLHQVGTACKVGTSRQVGTARQFFSYHTQRH